MLPNPPWLDDLEALLLDLDGVFYVDEQPIPGTGAAIPALRGLGLQLRVVTNTTLVSRTRLLAFLDRIGVEVAPSELFTPSALAHRLLQGDGPCRYRLLAAPDLEAELGPGRMDLAEPGTPEWIVLGLHRAALSPEALTVATRDLLGGAGFLALHANRLWRRSEGLVPGLGAWVAALEYATGVRATVVGKPSADFFRTALRDLELPPDRVAMVGDDVESDVGGAQAVGMRGVLVRTGKYDRDRVQRSGVRPDLVVDDVAELARVLVQVQQPAHEPGPVTPPASP